jgi:hypothetical protein
MAAEEKRFRRVVRSSAELNELQISLILSSKWNPWKSERLERTAAKMRAVNKRMREANNKRTSRQNL